MTRLLLRLFVLLKRTIGNIIQGLSINTFQGRTLLLLIFFVVTLTSLSGFTLYYNGRVQAINTQIIELRRPSTLYTSEILIGMNRSATMQNGYFLTQTESFRQERRNVWERKINPSIDTLLSLDERFLIEEVNITALRRLLEDYEKMQIDLENYFIENSDPTADYFERSSSDSRVEIVNNYIKQYNLEKLIPTQEQLIVMLTTLSERQESLLQEDINQIQTEITTFNFLVYTLIFVCVLLASFLGISVVNTIRESIRKPTEQIIQLAQGNLPDEVPKVDNEMKDIVLAGNHLAKHLRNASQFAYEIGEGNFNYAFSPSSEDDILGNALIQMRVRLMAIAETDKQQSWVTKGLASFVDILRNTDVAFEVLSDDIISMLVRYLGAQQGTLFIIASVDSNETILKQASYYAFDRKKFLEKDIRIYNDYAEGLVGQCFIEASTIYLTEIPKNYIQINSGLGQLPPRSILLVPLQYNDKVEGVIEVASLKAMKDYEIGFVEKLAESIAATIANFRNTEKTKQLLLDSQEQGEEMRAQEEEMRQNVEELAATQEEMNRKSNELEKLLAESKNKEQLLKTEREESARVNKMLQDILDGNDAATYVTDLTGALTMVNQQFASIFNKSREELIGKMKMDFMPDYIALLLNARKQDALNSKSVIKTKEVFSIDNNQLSFIATHFPLLDQFEQPYAVCGILVNEDILLKKAIG